MTTPAARRLSVGICTHRRPEILRRLLAEISAQAARLPPEITVGFVVVDDDPAGSAKAVVDAVPTEHGLEAVYACTGSGNISTARNRVIDLGLAAGDLLVMIDDDCMPQDTWLAELVRVQDRYDADCVTGPCADVAPVDAPRWIVEEPFLDAPAPIEDGSEEESGYIKNILLTTRFLASSGIRFDERFGARGGEDALFFHALTAAGVHRRHASGAVVTEPVPLARTTLRYQLRRRLWYGNSESLTCLASGRSTRFRLGARGVLAMVDGLAHPVRQIVRGARPQLRFALARLLQGVGRSLGAIGVPLRHH